MGGKLGNYVRNGLGLGLVLGVVTMAILAPFIGPAAIFVGAGVQVAVSVGATVLGFHVTKEERAKEEQTQDEGKGNSHSSINEAFDATATLKPVYRTVTPVSSSNVLATEIVSDTAKKPDFMASVSNFFGSLFGKSSSKPAVNNSVIDSAKTLHNSL